MTDHVLLKGQVSPLRPLIVNPTYFIFFSFRLLSVLPGHSGFFIPATTANDSDFEEFLSQILSITFLSFLNS